MTIDKYQLDHNIGFLVNDISRLISTEYNKSRCPACAEVMRPDVVLFGELLPEPALAELDRQIARGFDLVFSVGTSSLFPYVAWPVVEARQRGIPTVEINPGESSVSDVVEHRIRMGAKEAMEGIWKALGPRWS